MDSIQSKNTDVYIGARISNQIAYHHGKTAADQFAIMRLRSDLGCYNPLVCDLLHTFCKLNPSIDNELNWK